MKLREITLRGFRGFNEERSIPLHDRLTLISAPNSHGKTSISEGFEWLLYGYTSKVALADSKDEYKGSYRNVHLLEPESPSVKVVVQEGSSTTELLAIMSGTGAVLRVDGKVVASWPFSKDLRRPQNHLSSSMPSRICCSRRPLTDSIDLRNYLDSTN